VSITTSLCCRSEGFSAARFCLVLGFSAIACGGTLDAGGDEPKGQLPVDDRNAVVICNDGPEDNWQGEYAMLLASTEHLSLAGIVVSIGGVWQDLDENLAGWQQMVAAARQGGLRNIPDPVASEGSALERPSDGDIESTVPNGSEGARFIVETSKRLALPFRPLVVVTGGKLTDVADAYLMDHTLPDRVVVVSSLGSVTTDGGEMGVPNGEMDTWADIIVAQKFRYVQVSAFYVQAADVPSSLLPLLPANAFTAWIESKQPDVWGDVLVAADQVGVLAVAIPEFVAAVTMVVQDGTNSDGLPLLSSDPSGRVQLVTEVDGGVATAQFQQMLISSATFDLE
jgi:hypothetical protein